MRGATLQEFSLNRTSSRYDFLKSANSIPALYRLKTANIVSGIVQSTNDYDAEMRGVLVTMYDLLEQPLKEISVTSSVAKFTFESGNGFYIHNKEHLWDNLFTIQLENGDDRSEYLYGANNFWRSK